MGYRLGDGCDDFDKYLDPEAYYDPYFCGECDELFTNSGAFQFHNMLHEYSKSADPLSGSGGRGAADGNRPSSGKKTKKKRNARRKTASIDDTSDEECAEATAMVLGMIQGAGGQPGRDQFPYYCPECKGFASRGDYWYHMTKSHRKCVSCKRKFQSDELIEEHYVTSSTCLYWPAGMSANGGESDESDESMSRLIYRPVPAVDPQSNSLSRKPASYEECGLAESAANGPFRCLLCGEIPSSDSALNLHMSRSHNKCLRCKVQFESQLQLQEHFSTSKVHKYCQSCSLEFLCQKELEKHHKTHHPALTSTASSSKGKMGIEDDASVRAAFYICQFCTNKDFKSFSTAEKLESHLQREHIRCFPCKRAFAAQESLSKHLQMSSSHNYCHLCDTDFVSVEALERHSFMCNATLQLAAVPGITAPDQTEKRETDGFVAGKSEQGLDLSTEMGKLKFNGGSDESEWETDDGDEGDTEDLDPPPMVKTSSLKVFRDAPFSGRSWIAGKKAVKSVFKDAANNPRNGTLPITAVKSTPVFVATTEPRRGRDPSGTSIINYAGKFVCLVCSEDAGTGIALNQHYATAHSKCQRCNVQFQTQRVLYNHFLNSKVHLQKFCETCETCFSSKEGLRAHNAAFHSTKPTADESGGSFPCDACKVSTSFRTEEELEIHLQFEHYRCFPCKREFHQKKSFVDHLTGSNQHNYCVPCETDFECTEGLRYHVCPKAKPKEPLPFYDDWETVYAVEECSRRFYI